MTPSEPKIGDLLEGWYEDSSMGEVSYFYAVALSSPYKTEGQVTAKINVFDMQTHQRRWWFFHNVRVIACGQKHS